MKQYIHSDLDLSKASFRELRKAQKDWQARFDARDAEYNAQKNAFETERYAWADNLEALIREQFAEYLSKLPTIKIEVNPFSLDKVDISFKYEDHDNPDIALKWSYRIRLDDLGIRDSTNSWSGLQVVTPEQADDLINSANLLKALVSFNWLSLLDEAANTKPPYDDYIKIRDPRYDNDYKDPGFKDLLYKAEQVEIQQNVVGKPCWVMIKDYRTSARHWGHGNWVPTEHMVQIVSETDKFYKIKSDWDFNAWCYEQGYLDMPIDRASKDSIRFVTPLEVLTDEEFIEQKLAEYRAQQ